MKHRSNLESSLTKLQELLVEMGKRVEKATQEAVMSLKNGDLELAKNIVGQDPLLNQLEGQILELGAKTIATQQPIAKDMRKIVISFRIASDLERMGDLAVDIAKVTIRLSGQELMKPLIDIPQMADIVSTMIHESMESYIHEDVDLAYKMAKLDDKVDHLYSQVLHELFKYMIESPPTINQGMLLCFVGRYLERIADHATNIGENVVYLVSNTWPDLNA
ncbi:phosphate signaling complex protein PhoU [Paenibacillus alginolyticus]|uniref:Phosphate-specific transport system accessory protein PhoU n=1 Tax=Paenibacillus alginolyticus TaxID=59839 RepID=A0ABT4G7R6_9BACL|nr:phosphate signaling complex protein PhoU [Paenibacillus alginolyticus]MCY9692212.1 phosphate signaling complex protein PhoU [Paenibacillus alginolyticus]MEC0145949.1 phosphate signaling complex protein PhoU [Paenibacillus alginolyticus]